MGHHMKRNILKLRAALDALNPKDDGVDGKKDLRLRRGLELRAKSADNARGVNAIQRNMAERIGTFNDRIATARAAAALQRTPEQGFLTGLSYDRTRRTRVPRMRRRLGYCSRWIGSAAAWRVPGSFQIVDRNGNTIKCDQLDYNGQKTDTRRPAGDHQLRRGARQRTLFDALQVKLPVGAAMDQRVRCRTRHVAARVLAGHPFFHAGWSCSARSPEIGTATIGRLFNKLDFTYAANNWEWTASENPTTAPTGTCSGRSSAIHCSNQRIRTS